MTYIDIATFTYKAVLTIIGLAFMYIGLPWFKGSVIPWLKEKQLYEIIKKYVRAAEKMGASGAIEKSKKLEYVITLLKNRGVTITDEVRALIESAVGDLDDMFSDMISNVAKEIIIDGNGDEDE